MPSKELELALPTSERQQAYALDHLATGIGHQTVGLQVDQTKKNEMEASCDIYCEEKCRQGLV
jgi:hypothetical protein